MTNFESFSEDLIPRITPRPAMGPSLDISKPIVPEVSILFDNPKKTASAGDDQPMSYREWKEMQQNSGNKKKIVTFECPEQPVASVRSLPSAQTNPINANAYHPIGGTQHNIAQMERTVSPVGIANLNPLNEREVKDMNQPRSQWPQEQSQQFTVDDMYKLLTLQQNMQVATRKPAEAPAPTPVPPEPPVARQNVNVQDLFSLMLQIQQQTLQASRPKEDPSSPSLQPKPAETREVALRESQSERREDEPTTKDLLQIILKQQEQLMNVQSQVHALVRAVSSNSSQSFANNQQAQKQMSVMTSLEINVQKIRNKKSPLDRRIIDTPAPALYEEENEIEDKENQCCRCDCKCGNEKAGYPEAGVIRRSNLSSGSETVTTTSPQSASGQPGWALCGNILSQVNDVLQNSPPADAPKAQSARTEQQCVAKPPHPSDRNNYVASAQFKQFGIHFDDVNLAATSKRVTTYDSTPTTARRAAHFQSPAAMTEKSMLMNALAMKYLSNEPSPNECTPKRPTSTSPQLTDANNAPNCSPSDMSMASYKYMEKYGLL